MKYKIITLFRTSFYLSVIYNIKRNLNIIEIFGINFISFSQRIGSLKNILSFKSREEMENKFYKTLAIPAPLLEAFILRKTVGHKLMK
jgi:hypothetical protein